MFLFAVAHCVASSVSVRRYGRADKRASFFVLCRWLSFMLASCCALSLFIGVYGLNLVGPRCLGFSTRVPVYTHCHRMILMIQVYDCSAHVAHRWPILAFTHTARGFLSCISSSRSPFPSFAQVG